MKKQLIDFLSKIPFINNYFSGIATIFMLHRVAPFEEGKLFPNENMKVSPEFLEKFIVECKNKGYDFISLDELYEIILSGKKPKRYKIVLTLDDGYKDNCEIAYPIFRKHNTPFTIYLTTSFPNKTALLWWYNLEKLIIENKELKIEDKIFRCKTYDEKNKVFLEIRRMILQLNQKNLKSELDKLFENYDINWYEFNDKLCMTWEDIESISRDKLCTIGGHTVNHYAFNRLDKEEIIREIDLANKEIRQKTGKKARHFAYPFGNVDEVEKRDLEMTKKFNFKTVTTTRNGTIYLEHKDYTNCCLPRIMLTERFMIENIGRTRKQRVATI